MNRYTFEHKLNKETVIIEERNERTAWISLMDSVDDTNDWQLISTEELEPPQSSVQVRIKKLSDTAVIPSYAKDGDAAMDLTATSYTRQDNYLQYGTGLAIEIPKGYLGIILPRSSVSNTGLLFNTSGLVDSGYRGELSVRFKRLPNQPRYHVGDRVGQLFIIPYPKVEWEEVTELSSSERGEGGHGSTGK